MQCCQSVDVQELAQHVVATNFSQLVSRIQNVYHWL